MNSEKLNDSQRKAVEYCGKHLLVLAGAGTGKTHTIVSRAAFLIANGVQARRIQILSFTRKSASEIVERVNSMFRDSKDAKQLSGSTFHAWCMKMIKTNPKVFGFGDHTVIDRDDQLGIFKLICGKNYKVIEETRLDASTLLDLYSFARNTKKNLTETVRFKLFSNSNNDSTDDAITTIKPYLTSVFSGYELKKRERKYLDYDDILGVVSTGLKNNHEARDYISSQYDHILVDEMQDTNPLQWELLSSFQEKCCLFCVGDDAQSFYAFRGADFTNVHKFSERVADSSTYRLEDNYRSTQEILDLSNWLLQESPLNYSKKLKAARGLGELPVIVNFENEWTEAEWVACDILENFTKDGLAYANHLILVRSVYAGRNIEHFLLEKNIPYKVYGGVSLMTSAHIRDVASALRIIANIFDEIAWMRYLQIWSKIGDVTAARLINELLDLSNIDECIELLVSKELPDSDLVNTLFAIKELDSKPSEAIKIALSVMESQLSKKYKTDWERKRKPDFNIMVKLAEKHGSIGDFIAEYILDPQLNESFLSADEVVDQVIISTIHSAKGLEAKVCYVINVSVGAYPSIRSINEGESAIEEERRVLYVALTRAKDELFVTRIMDKNLINNYHLYDTEQNNDDEREPCLYFLDGLPTELALNEISQQTKDEISNKTYTGKTISESDIGMDLS
jgi:DNA helicase II / ATP-dependent DNA helicase PcrA